jgi:hypothetical protein
LQFNPLILTIALLSETIQRGSEPSVHCVLPNLSPLKIGCAISCEVGKIGLHVFFRFWLQVTCVIAGVQDEFDMRCVFDQGSYQDANLLRVTASSERKSDI